MALVTTLLIVVAPSITGDPLAAAAPGSPGTPGEPTLLYEEDFENRQLGSNILLTEYVARTGVRYGADPTWVNRVYCNGFIIDQTSPRTSTDCTGTGGAATSYNNVTAVGYAIAVMRGSATPGQNAAAASYTAGSSPDNAVQFRTLAPLVLPTVNRFVTFSVDAGAMNCHATHPKLRFYLVDESGTEHPVSSQAIDPCTDPRRQVVTSRTQSGGSATVSVGSFAADASVLLQGSRLGIVMRNENGSAIGNDGAYDNIQVLDVTPQLDKAFAPTVVPVGGLSTLTFTVTNTAELAAKSGWGFTDSLPEGLVVADPASVGGTCTATTSASAGAAVISVSDGILAAGQVSCTVTVDVTSDSPTGGQRSPKTYENCAANLSEVRGLDLPGCASVEFYSTPELELTKTSDATPDTRQGDTVTYVVTARNVGTGDYTAAEPAVVMDDLRDVLDDASYNGDVAADRRGSLSFAQSVLSWSGALPVGDSVSVIYSVTLGSGGDGSVRNVAWAPSDPADRTPPACAPPVDGVDGTTGEPCATHGFELPRLTISKKADRTELPMVGEQVTYAVTLTNTGPGDYTVGAPATLTDDLSGVLDAATYNDDATATVGNAPTYAEPELAWSGPLAAGESVVITYSVTYTGGGDHVLRNLACVPRSAATPSEPTCDFVQIPGAGLTHWKQVSPSSDPVFAGSVLTYTVFLKNDGSIDAQVDLVDDLSQVTDDADVSSEPVAATGLTAVRQDDRIAISGTVPSGATRAVTYAVTIRADGQRGDDLAVNFLLDPGAPPPAGPQCEPADLQLPDCTVTPVASALRYDKAVAASTDPVGAGTALTYTVTVTNPGRVELPVAREDVLDDVLDDATLTREPSSDTPSVTATPVSNDHRFTIGGTLGARRSATVTYEATVRSESERGNNRIDNFLVPPGGTPSGECVADDPWCTRTPLAQVLVAKTADPPSGAVVKAGEQVAYTLTFTNAGIAIGAVDHQDDLSGVLDDAALTTEPTVSDSALTASTGADGTIRVTGSVAPDQTVTVSYAVTVRADGQRGDNRLVNVVTSRATGECAPAPDATCTTEHLVPEVRSAKSVSPASGSPVVAGQEVTYTLTFENTGRGAAEVDHTDHLRDVLDDSVWGAVDHVAEGLAVSEPDRDVLSVRGTLRPGAVATVTYTVTVKQDGEQGNHLLANFLTVAGQEPPAHCSDNDPLCTQNPTEGAPNRPSPEQVPGASGESGTPGIPGGVPGPGGPVLILVLLGILILGVGVGVLVLARRGRVIDRG